MKKIIQTNEAPQAIGPYSQAVVSNGFLFISGQLGLGVDGNFPGEDVRSQAIQSLENIKNILKQSGVDFKDVIKTTIFLTNMNDFAEVNEVYSKYFTENFPARSTIEVKGLPKGGVVEIEVIALVK